MQALTESIRLNSGAEAFVEILRYANKAQVMLHRVTGGGTLLHYVLTASIHIEKRPVMLGALLDKGVDPYVQDDSGDCFFHIMGKNGQSPEELMAELEVLCSHGVDLNRPNRAGLTFLDIYRKSLEERYKGKTVDSYEESYRTVCSVIRRAQTSTSPKAAQRPSALSKDK
jgi:hypothetical protein